MLLATAVMTLVGLSLNNFYVFTANIAPLALLIVIPGFSLSFIGHELAHKFLAQRNGLWAEFRTSAYGLMMTIVSVVFPIKFLAPGQTNIQGNGRKEILGTIGLIGPGFNIALGIGFYIISRVSGSDFGQVFLELVTFNAWLAIFNLIPFGSFDGTRVFEWDRMRWAIAFGASILLIVLSYYPTLIWH
ncbi:MAG: zinc metalloprotease [Nitrososphaerales archaeon]